MPTKRKKTQRGAPAQQMTTWRLQAVIRKLGETPTSDVGFNKAIDSYDAMLKPHLDWLAEIYQTVKEQIDNAESAPVDGFASPALPKTPSQQERRVQRQRNRGSADTPRVRITRAMTRKLEESMLDLAPNSNSETDGDDEVKLRRVSKVGKVVRKRSSKKRKSRQRLRAAVTATAEHAERLGATPSTLAPTRQPLHRVTPATPGHATTARTATKTVEKSTPAHPSRTPATVRTNIKKPDLEPKTPSTQRTPVVPQYKQRLRSFLRRNSPEPKSQIRKREQLLKRDNQNHEKASENKQRFLRARVEETRKKREEREKRVNAKQQIQKENEERQRWMVEEQRNAVENIQRLQQQKFRTPKTPQNPTPRQIQRKTPAATPRHKIAAKRSSGRKKKSNKSATPQQIQRKTPAATPKHKIAAKDSSERKRKSSKKMDQEQSKVQPTAKSRTEAEQNGQTAGLRRETYTSPRPKNFINYCIDDLNSGDETDDEEAPRKPIPAWALGNNLKSSLIHQYYNPPPFDQLFGAICTPLLEQMFTLQRRRFKLRTSSAQWDSSMDSSLCQQSTSADSSRRVHHV